MDPEQQSKNAEPAWRVWTARVLVAMMSLVFGMSGLMKLRGGPDLARNIEPIGLKPEMIFPLGIVELTCLVIYLIPATRIIGAILLTGYMGGAICTHWRVGEPFVPQVVIGVMVWLGVWLSDPALRKLIPFRRG